MYPDVIFYDIGYIMCCAQLTIHNIINFYIISCSLCIAPYVVC